MTVPSRRLPGIGAHHSARPRTDEWLTPPHVLDALGTFDLDPCVPVERPDWTGAALTYDAGDDGLHQRWPDDALAWVNPPYSAAGVWARRLAEHGDGLLLVFARTETAWWHDHIWPHARLVLFLRGRLTFHRPDGTASKAGHNSGGPSAIAAYGDEARHRLKIAHHRGLLPGALVRKAYVP